MKQRDLRGAEGSWALLLSPRTPSSWLPVVQETLLGDPGGWGLSESRDPWRKG